MKKQYVGPSQRVFVITGRKLLASSGNKTIKYSDDSGDNTQEVLTKDFYTWDDED